MSNAKIWRLLRTPVPGNAVLWVFLDMIGRPLFAYRRTSVGWIAWLYPITFMYERNDR